MKKIFFIIVLLGFLFIFKTNIAAKEPAHVLIINQIRGEECCSKGSFAKLKTQVETHLAKKIPAYFALRYDVLTDDSYIDYLKDAGNKYPDLIKFGLLIEMTPGLIKTVGVKHDINNENWFEAQNAFTIGYSKSDSKKIVDHLFAIFFEKFGYYPLITSSWMIDTETLNYIHTEYGVKIQQITREQYGTDSYTLYGGPPHYPYPASKNWLFIPDYENENPVLIVRQTVTDPLFNYGDNTNTFTSQPNDYLKSKKNFDYFTALVNQAINQPNNQTGFAMFGLENSMEDKYQNEYIAQLELMGKKNSEGLIKFISIEELFEYWKQNKISIYSGKNLVNDLDFQAFWITTPFYRVRIIKKNDDILITDLRLYDKNFSDPYNNYAALKSGYWIAPYLVNGSFNFHNGGQKPVLIKDVSNLPTASNGLFDLKKDFEIEPSAIVLPKIIDKGSFTFENKNNDIILSYKKSSNAKIKITFKDRKIIFNPLDKNEILYKPNINDFIPVKYIATPSGFNLEWKINNKTFISLENICTNKICEINFNTYPDLITEVRSKQYPFLFPEPINRKVDEKISLFYPHNQYAVAGRNPVRLIFSGRDIYNSPVVTTSNINVFASSSVKKTAVMQNPVNQFIHYIDIYNDQPKKLTVSIKLNKNMEIKLNQPVFFAPNCKKQIKYCLTHPIEAYWYLRSFISDKTRK